MTLTGLALFAAGAGTNDPWLTIPGLILAAIGAVVFVWRQVTHKKDPSDAGVDARIVKVQAPATLVAVLLGITLLLIGRGAFVLTAVDDDSGESAADVVVPATTTDTTTTSTPPPVTTVPAPTTTVVDDNTETDSDGVTTDEPAPLPDELPVTGISTDLALFAVVLLAAGRWARLTA